MTEETETKLLVDIRVNKKCPKCKTSLSDTIFNNVEVDYCPKCLGLWFEEEELRLAKDAKDKELKWVDVDIWQDEKKFKISQGIRLCPQCRMPLYEVYYGGSENLPAGRQVIVDVCNLCHGIWLDRGEFIKIIKWLREQRTYGILNNYTRNLFKEAGEILTGPEPFKEEIFDFLAVLKILPYKFLVQYPLISKIISNLPR
jgi:hypothetical protein